MINYRNWVPFFTENLDSRASGNDGLRRSLSNLDSRASGNDGEMAIISRLKRAMCPYECQKNAIERGGFTLIELLAVMAVGATLVVLIVPLFFETFSSRLKTSAQNLSEDMRFAQNEAVRQGDANPAGGSFRARKAFVVFDIADNTYSIWRWEDFNGNNVREAGEFSPDLDPTKLGNPANDGPVRTGRLDNGVYFRIHGDVTRNACGSTGPVPGNPVTFLREALLPCNGNPCIRFDGKGFIEGINGAAYLTDENHSYAISANRVGLFNFCRWDASTGKWVLTH